MCPYAVQLAQKAYDAARAFAAQRLLLGGVIGGFPLVRELLDDIAMAITTSRLLCPHALDAIAIPDGTNQTLTLIEGRKITGIPAYRH